MQHDKQVSNVLLLPDEMPCVSHLCAFRSLENRVQIEIQSSGSQKKISQIVELCRTHPSPTDFSVRNLIAGIHGNVNVESGFPIVSKTRLIL